LTDAVGPRAVWLLAGVACGLAAIVGLAMARGVAMTREPALQTGH
jgi:hypothetical protein